MMYIVLVQIQILHAKTINNNNQSRLWPVNTPSRLNFRYRTRRVRHTHRDQSYQAQNINGRFSMIRSENRSKIK